MRVKHTLLKLSLTSVLGMALLAGACSEQGTQPEQISAGRLSVPSDADFARGGVQRKDYRRLSLTNPAPVQAAAEIGPRGGILQAEHYFLLVPAGAVKEKTNFTMDVGTDGVVTLEATITRQGHTYDVGGAGFAKNVILAMYYGHSPEAIADEASLQVTWLRNNGTLSLMPSVVNKEYKLVYGQLSHFSQYALATPRDDYDAF